MYVRTVYMTDESK